MGRIKQFNKNRKFRGNQYTKKAKAVAEIPATPQAGNTNSNVGSASKRKLSYLENNVSLDGKCSSSNEGNIIIDISVLSTFLNKSVACANCKNVGSVNLFEERGSRKGLASKIKLECTYCKYKATTMTSNVNNKRIYNINIRFAYAMRCIGKGTMSASTLCAVMDLPPPPKFERYCKVLLDGLKEVAEGSMLNAAREAKIMEAGSDVTGVFDGSWQKRGHSSLHGVVTVTSFISGKVLDVVSYSKYCSGCNKGGEHECVKNFEGYSGGMEVVGAVDLCKKSEMTRGLRYVRYLGDGDSKGFLAVQEAKPYGNDITIEKLECIAHVQKRMGSHLRKLCKDMKGKKLSDGKLISGRGRLTGTEIDKLQNYYGMAIRNIGNLKEMKKAVWATYFHKHSTDENPNHGLCPMGPMSWCKYNRSLTTDAEYKHKRSLPSAVLQVMKPIYKKLADGKLLEKCLHGKTQNQNESFNNCIWERVPKNVFIGANTIKMGVFDAVICFNDGAYKRVLVLQALDIKPGENMKKALRGLDMERITKSEKATEQVTKEARMKRRSQKRKKEDKESQEQDSYGPGEY